MTKLILTPDDIHPLLEGLAIMGTGGGGNPTWGRMILEQDVRMGRTWNIIAPEDVPDEATVVSGGIMGSVKALEAIGFENVLQQWETRFQLFDVTRVMAGLLKRPIDAIVPFEAGGLNTPVILSLGARAEIPVIDGDALGRSAPETNMTSFIGHGINIPPMPLIDHYGNVVIVQEAAAPTYPDEIGRFVVSKGGAMGANNHYPMTGAQLKQAVIPHTITQALELGRAVRAARQQGTDPAAAVAEHLNSRYRFQGVVTSLREEEHLGFYFTTANLAPTEQPHPPSASLPAGRGRSGAASSAPTSPSLPAGRGLVELVIKNETMLLQEQGEIVCMFPDMIVMLEPGTGRGVMSVELREGLELVLLAGPCHPRLQAAALTAAGQAAMGPARFGHPNLIYQPMS
jgi:hypothetical protein